MRRYLIGGIGVVMAAMWLTIPTATAEAHSAPARYHGQRARGYARHIYPVRPAYRVGPRVYAPLACPVPSYRPGFVVPRSVHYRYWHHHR